MPNIFKEPLVHFFILGFISYLYLLNAQVLNEEIIVSTAKINQLKSQFANTHLREASDEELDSLIDDYVKDIIAFQKGEELGLIADDVIIQRRVRQKIEFMLEDSIAILSPSKEELLIYMSEHQKSFMQDEVYSFLQIYIDTSKHDDVDSYIKNILLEVDTKNHSSLGDNLMLDTRLTGVTSSQITRTFGKKFMQNLEKLEPYGWHRVQSGYGLHLVKIMKKTPANIGSFEENEDKVRAMFIHDAQKNALNAFYAQAKKGLSIQVGDK